MIQPSSMRDKIFQEMVEHIETMIALGKYPPGSRIPTLRELSREFNLSTGTVVRGIKFLVDSQVLESRHGSGTFVRRPDLVRFQGGEKEMRIGVFLRDNDTHAQYCAQALLGVQDEAQHHACRLMIRFCEHREITRKLLEMAAAENDVILLLGDYDNFLPELPRSRPYVGLEMHNSYDGLNSTVTLDPVDAAETAVRFFRERGCGKVVAFSHPGLVHATRAVMFRESWARAGGELVLREFAGGDMGMYELFDFRDPAVGFFFVSGTTANKAAVAYRQESGKLLAAERHILSIDGKSRFARNFEPMNTIGIDWLEAGRLAFHECRRRISNPGSAARRIYVHGHYYAHDADHRSAGRARKKREAVPAG